MRTRGFLGFLGLLLVLSVPTLVNAASNKAAVTFEVNSLGDHAADPCDAECTLRDAVVAANLNSGADVVGFASGLSGVLALSQGQIAITDGVDIQGPGADTVTVHAAADSRIFLIGGIASASRSVTISGLTLTGGDVHQPGGAIFSQTLSCGADLTLSEVLITGNVATGEGAGVAVKPNWGGCVAPKTAGKVTTTTVPPTSTSIPTPADEGALTIRNSTISNNISTANAGGVAFWSSRAADGIEISNSTITGNSADGSGGGVGVCCVPRAKVIAAFPAAVANSTITDNTTGGDGGGIHADSTPLALSSSIVYGNTETRPDTTKITTSPSDLAGTFSVGYSLIGTTDGATVNAIGGQPNIVGPNPQLGALGNNGGPTPTQLPADSSPAIDAGTANSLQTDQRGKARTVDFKGVTAVADGTDIGAVEVENAPVTPTTTTTTSPTTTSSSTTPTSTTTSTTSISTTPTSTTPTTTTTTTPTTTPTTTTTTTTTLPAPPTEDCAGQKVILTKGDDGDNSLTGTSADDGIVGAGGADTIDGVDGDDCLYGQVGNDTVAGGPGADNVNGDRDDDVVSGDEGADSVRGQNGDDRVSGGDGDDHVVTGGFGDDQIKGGPGADHVKGSGGDDVIDLGSGKDFVHAGGGADEIFAADGERDEVICGTGKDVAHIDPIDDVDEDCNTVDSVR